MRAKVPAVGLDVDPDEGVLQPGPADPDGAGAEGGGTEGGPAVAGHPGHPGRHPLRRTSLDPDAQRILPAGPGLGPRFGHHRRHPGRRSPPVVGDDHHLQTVCLRVDLGVDAAPVGEPAGGAQLAEEPGEVGPGPGALLDAGW